jgi:NadR type nicotinamide-nucleotide adenylyltransferase
MNAVPVPPAKKVVVIGPECTGKSALSAFLAEHYKTSWVPEYARGYIDNLTRPYNESELITIAHGQTRLEDEWPHESSDLLICDTNLYVIKIWSEFKYGHCHAEILKQINSRKYDLYLLTYIDIPWQDDPQREHPNNREELYQLYLKDMKAQSVPFVEIRGERNERRASAIEAVNKILVS